MEAVNDLSAILRACYSRIMHTINCIVAADMRYRDCKIFLFFLGGACLHCSREVSSKLLCNIFYWSWNIILEIEDQVEWKFQAIFQTVDEFRIECFIFDTRKSRYFCTSLICISLDVHRSELWMLNWAK